MSACKCWLGHPVCDGDNITIFPEPVLPLEEPSVSDKVLNCLWDTPAWVQDHHLHLQLKWPPGFVANQSVDHNMETNTDILSLTPAKVVPDAGVMIGDELTLISLLLSPGLTVFLTPHQEHQAVPDPACPQILVQYIHGGFLHPHP